MIQTTSDRVFVFLTPTDMRKSYDTLAALIMQNNMDPVNGDIYVFTNKRKNRFKILVWEKDGYWLCCKRLEAGTFAVPFVNDDSQAYTMKINLTELRLLIEGIEIGRIKKSKRFNAENLQK